MGATLLDRVAGGADLAHALTSRRVGGGEEGAEIDGERLRPGAGAGFRNRQDGLLDMGHVASKLGRVARLVHAGGPGALEGGKIDRHGALDAVSARLGIRSEEHTSELQSLMRISYAVFCLKKKNE